MTGKKRKATTAEAGGSGLERLRAEVLRREPVEPAAGKSSRREIFLYHYIERTRKKDRESSETKLRLDGKEIWRAMEEKEKNNFIETAILHHEEYCEAYSVFVWGLTEELKIYQEIQARRDAEDEVKRATESSDEEDETDN